MLAFALIVAGVVLVLDQITKVWILDLMSPPRIIPVTDFFNLVLVWNRGISFGLLGGGTASWQPYLLGGFSLAVAIGLSVWVRKACLPRWPSLGVGLIVGGAIGNAIDRVLYGAVVDFADVHVAGWHWPAFNIADAGITIGVILLLADGLLRREGEGV